MIPIQTYWTIFGAFPFILVLAVIALVIFSAYMIFGGAASRYERIKNEIGPKFIRNTAPSLQIWEPVRAFSEMSSELWRTTEVSFFGGRWSHARGTIRSLHHRGDKWVAFVLCIRGHGGQIDLRTFSSDFSLEYAGHLGTFRIAGTLKGYINIRSEVLDQSGRPIGHILYHPTNTPMGRGNNTSLEIDGKTIAKISYLSDFGDRLWKAPPLVQETSQNISSNEADWVLAVIAMRLYSHCRTTRLT
jgi:hypothetical protein